MADFRSSGKMATTSAFHQLVDNPTNDEDLLDFPGPAAEPFPLLRLPPELQEEIFKLAVVLRDERTGARLPIDMKTAVARRTDLFCTTQINKEINSAFGTLALKYNTFRFKAEHTRRNQPIQSRADVIFYGRFGIITGAQSAILRSAAREGQEGFLSNSEIQRSSRLGYHMALPSVEARRYLRNIELVLIHPLFYKQRQSKSISGSHGGEKDTSPEDEWLYPVRALQTLGFGKLKQLTIIVDIYMLRSKRTEKDDEALIDLVQDYAATVEVAAEKTEVRLQPRQRVSAGQ